MLSARCSYMITCRCFCLIDSVKAGMALPKVGEALGNIHVNLDMARLWLIVTLVYEAAGAGVHPRVCRALLARRWAFWCWRSLPLVWGFATLMSMSHWSIPIGV